MKSETSRPPLKIGSDGRRHFENIFVERRQGAGWSVVQAATLLAEAKSKRCSSLIIYAALELRLAIEQLVFTVIVAVKAKVNDELFQECKKKDGLFRVLDDVAPKYSMRCRFANMLASFSSHVPQIAEWDVRSLRRFYTQLSDLCHSQLVIQGIEVAVEKWDEKIKMLEEVHDFLATNLIKGTGVIAYTDPMIIDLWDQFSEGKIDLETARRRVAIIAP